MEMRCIVFVLLLITRVAEVRGDLECDVQEPQDAGRDDGLIPALLSEFVVLSATVEKQGLIIGQQAEDIKNLIAMMQEKCRGNGNERADTLLEAPRNSTIDERVTLLESQMLDVQEDLTELDEDVTGHDEAINFLYNQQVVQDERLLNLEEENDATNDELDLAEDQIEGLQDTTSALDFRVTALEENGGSGGNSSIVELEERVEALEETAAEHDTEIADLESITGDHETRLTAAEENIEGLVTMDTLFDARITALEESGGGGGNSQNGTIAFHAALTEYDEIPEGTPVIFNEVFLNEGHGYNSTTGKFTVPSGGEGFYYFSTDVTLTLTCVGLFYISVNGDRVCNTWPDDSSAAADLQQGSCSAVVNLIGGDEVGVVYDYGCNTTPLYRSTSNMFNVFNGFRI